MTYEIDRIIIGLHEVNYSFHAEISKMCLTQKLFYLFLDKSFKEIYVANFQTILNEHLHYESYLTFIPSHQSFTLPNLMLC
jgi:hypothetical protein